MIPLILIADSSVLKDEALYQSLYSCAPPERRELSDRFKFNKDKFNSLAVWKLLDISLRRRGYRPEDLSFEKTEYGKPFIKELPGLHFNLSHSGERAVCAVWESDIGCDVEQLRPQNLMIADRFFTSTEKERLALFDSEDLKSREFCRIWTLKESYLKCIGKGLYQSPESFSICFDEERAFLKEGGFSFFEYSEDPEYRISCCIKGEVSEIEFEITDLKKQVC